MTMAEGMVRPDALSERDGRLALALHLPWYRSLPISCLEAVEVSVDGTPAAVTSVRVPGFDGSVAEAAASDADWDLRDALDVSLDRAGESGTHALEVTLAVRIPYLQTAPGVALVQRATARTARTPTLATTISTAARSSSMARPTSGCHRWSASSVSCWRMRVWPTPIPFSRSAG